MEEIPANPIEPVNPNFLFSPLKIADKNEKEPLPLTEQEEEKIAAEDLVPVTESIKSSWDSGSKLNIVDEEITIGVSTKISSCKSPELHVHTRTEIIPRLQRKSDEDLCNTPKRERHNDELFIADTDGLDYSAPKTPPRRGQLVKSLSMEFEQRLASINVSPRPTPGSSASKNNTVVSHSSPRLMSPIRNAVQSSPVSKLILNEGADAIKEATNDTSAAIQTPTLISPSKVAAANASKSESEAKWSKQIEFLQFEVSTLQEKYEESIKNNSEMRTMLAEYEKTLAQFIDARRSRPDQHSSLDQVLQDKKRLEVELQSLQISYQNLHQRYEDMKGLQEQSKISDASLRQSIQLLQQELASTVRTLDNTRRAYEDKMEKLSVEEKNVKESLEYELSATKAKLLKSELKISSLESAIETKTRENSELMTICDELIHKMDKRTEK